MTLRAKEVHRALRAIVGPLLKSKGFRSLPGTNCGYAKKIDSYHCVIWMQCDKWGWDSFTGSRFCVNIHIHPEFAPLSRDPRAKDWRFYHSLEADERADYVILWNRVLPKLNKRAMIAEMRSRGDHESSILAIEKSMSPLVAPPFSDGWCNYYDIVDVERWGAFLVKAFERHLPALERMTAEAAAAARTA